jgi:hypothetical protein
MLTKMNIHKVAPLWTTPVEKPVENVENYEFSTAIPQFYLWRTLAYNFA